MAAAAVSATALVVAGWTSGLRQVMHGALLTLAVAALLPFVLIAGGLLVIMLTGLLLALPAALSSGAGEGVLEGGGWLVPRYYRLLGRQRHPVFWGVPAGVLLGALLLWALIAALVVPDETRTVRMLTEAKARIERVHAESGGFPRPDERGRLPFEDTASGVLEDGFGRPLQYEVTGRWQLASWTLTSLGFDGKPSADDLCVSGSTRLMEWASRGASLDDRLAGIRALRCPAK